jgi:uncharacterized protein
VVPLDVITMPRPADEHPPPRAAVVETHISTLFFVGDLAVKVKKPVRTGFLDFSTRLARRRACEREVTLNRRLSPDVYLGVADVRGPDRRVCEHMVVMRRMPEPSRLATLVRRGAPIEVHLRRIARKLAAFHAGADTSPRISRAGTARAVLANWGDNTKQMRRFAGSILEPARLEAVDAMARRYIAGRGPLFAARIAAGKVRDGHGDLLADDIFCLDDGPRILDCVEFDDALRHGDVIADVAFLAMDLERLGAPQHAQRLLRWYMEYTGESAPASLVDHYVAYRAQVRSKVACLAAEQGDVEAAAQAGRLLSLAAEHLMRARVRLVLVGGLPGSGKSTLSEGIAATRSWMLLRSDEIRKQLAGLDAHAEAAAPYGRGLYAPRWTAHTYREMLGRAERALRHGESVVLDASWTDARWRRAAARVAEATASDLVELECVASPSIVRQRLRDRALRGPRISDATPQVAERMAALAQPWPEAVQIDTTGRADVALAAALQTVDAEPEVVRLGSSSR